MSIDNKDLAKELRIHAKARHSLSRDARQSLIDAANRLEAYEAAKSDQPYVSPCVRTQRDNIEGNEQPVGWSDSDLKSLNYDLWKRVGYDGSPPCSGEYEIRLEDGQITKADYNTDYATFYFAGDYEIHLSKVEWRDIYAPSPKERAAREFLAQARNTRPKRESGNLLHSLLLNAPVDQPEDQ